MAVEQSTTLSGNGQMPMSRRLRDLADNMALVDDSAILAKLRSYRRFTGRPGYPLRALWRAYVSSFLLNLPSINELIRELEDRPDFRTFCGFGDVLPHRTTFNRFVHRLSEHVELVEMALAKVTERVKGILPDFGKEVAVDSTTVRSHSNPNRKRISDPEASWTAKNAARAKSSDGKEWHWGYKVHMVADANYGLPLAHFTTTASRSDSPELPNVIDKAKRLFRWFRPRALMADRGYDAASNHKYLSDDGILPIIHIRKPSHTDLVDGIYTKEGVPTCIGQVPMEYVRSDPEKGWLYQCVGCHLKDSSKYRRHCDYEVWEDPKRNPRLFGAIRRNSPEWNALYAKRQAIERTFKSLKESRRLERHYERGLRKVTLHATMSAITYQITSLAKILKGQWRRMRWMVRKVA